MRCSNNMALKALKRGEQVKQTGMPRHWTLEHPYPSWVWDFTLVQTLRWQGTRSGIQLLFWGVPDRNGIPSWRPARRSGSSLRCLHIKDCLAGKLRREPMVASTIPLKKRLSTRGSLCKRAQSADSKRTRHPPAVSGSKTSLLPQTADEQHPTTPRRERCPANRQVSHKVGVADEIRQRERPPPRAVQICLNERNRHQVFHVDR